MTDKEQLYAFIFCTFEKYWLYQRGRLDITGKLKSYAETNCESVLLFGKEHA
jgi:hypothetical protein